MWLLCFAGGGMIFLSTVLVAASCSIAPLSLIWTITNLAPLVPVAAGILFFSERLTAGAGIALVLFCGMVALFARGVGRAGDIRTGKAWTAAAACAAILATNGLWLVCTKLKERLFDGAFSAQFMLVCYGTAALCSVLWYVKRHGRTRLHAVEWAAGGCAGAASAAGTLLLLGAMSLPSAVVFPVSTGLSLVIGVALGAAIFRERMNFGKLAGIGLGCAAVVLVLLRGH
jgi:drug/metabolite transporter (DMT)-like permease